jgi:hypothetical protein
MVLAEARPAARIKGVGRRVRQEIRDILRDHLYRNESCGESPLCAINEPIDAWVGRAGKDSVR